MFLFSAFCVFLRSEILVGGYEEFMYEGNEGNDGLEGMWIEWKRGDMKAMVLRREWDVCTFGCPEEREHTQPRTGAVGKRVGRTNWHQVRSLRKCFACSRRIRTCCFLPQIYTPCLLFTFLNLKFSAFPSLVNERVVLLPLDSFLFVRGVGRRI